VRGLRPTELMALVSCAAIMAAPLAASAQTGASDGMTGMTPLIIVAAALVLIGLAGAFLPRLRPLSGRLVVRDAFGPSVFATTSLAAARSWQNQGDLDPVPSREGLLIGLEIKRGLGRHVEVSLRFEKGGQTREVVAGRLAPGQKERVGDLVIDYDDGRGPEATVS
jgi:hypothetical protein